MLPAGLPTESVALDSSGWLCVEGSSVCEIVGVLVVSPGALTTPVSVEGRPFKLPDDDTSSDDGNAVVPCGADG